MQVYEVLGEGEAPRREMEGQWHSLGGLPGGGDKESCREGLPPAMETEGTEAELS